MSSEPRIRINRGRGKTQQKAREVESQLLGAEDRSHGIDGYQKEYPKKGKPFRRADNSLAYTEALIQGAGKYRCDDRDKAQAKSQPSKTE